MATTTTTNTSTNNTQPLTNMIETSDQNDLILNHNDEETKMFDKRTDLESIELTKIAKLSN